MKVADRRRLLAERLFPQGLPRLWCPPLTHYTAAGALDGLRIGRHLHQLAAHVGAVLVPGSTGEGWEMSADERRNLLKLVLNIGRREELPVLIGILNTDANAALAEVRATLAWLKEMSGCAEPDAALLSCGVCGLTVCPPHGADRTQQEITEALAAILELGAPTALYQLPQVTENEMTPETVAALADRFANFYLFKDTSGRDVVARSGVDLQGVYLVRGAEGEYARWQRSAGGPYDGFLLSTANCFAPQQRAMLRLVEQGRANEAGRLIAPVERVVKRAFELVAGIAAGNPFTNANKAIDHFLAHSAGALNAAPPRLHAGTSIPLETLQAIGECLQKEDLLPATGYLASQP